MYKYEDPSSFEIILQSIDQSKTDQYGLHGQYKMVSSYMVVEAKSAEIISRNTSEPNIIYHYCNTNAFFNIVNSKKLWLSSIFSTNDSQEGKFVFELLKSYCYNLKNLTPDQKNIIKKIQSTAALNIQNAYSISFSTKNDNLGQWRGYGNDGSGFAIGFSPIDFPMTRGLPNRLYQNYAPLNSAFLQVNYSRTETENMIKDIIDKALNKELSPENVGFFIAKISYICKHPSFQEEEEWRILYLPNEQPSFQDIIQIQNKDNIENEKNNKWYISPICYRIQKDNIISYYETPIPNIKNCTIKEVVLGPKNKSLPHQILDFLTMNGFKKNIHDEIKVYKSSCPLQ